MSLISRQMNYTSSGSCGHANVGYAQDVQSVPISPRLCASFSRTHHSADFARTVSHMPTTPEAWDAQQQSSYGYGQLHPYQSQPLQSSQQHVLNPSTPYLGTVRATNELNRKFNHLSPSGAFDEIDVDSMMKLLKVCLQRLSENAEAMKELYHWRQTMMADPSIGHSAIPPIPNGDALLPFTDFGGSETNAFQYHAPQSFGMDILHHADTRCGVGFHIDGSMTVTGQQQALAALSHDTQTRMSETGEEILPCQSYHEKRTTPFIEAYATSPQSTNFDYGHAQEIIFSSASSGIQGSTTSPAAVDTSANKDHHAKSSVVAPPMDGPTVLAYMLGGINHYRCECGFENTRKGALDRHLESLQHSKRKYECSCGKKFTRYDSLNRHRKRCKVDGVEA